MGSIGIIHLSNVTQQHAENTFNLICSAEKEHLDITMGNIRQSVDIMRDLMLSELRSLDDFKNNAQHREFLTQEFARTFFLIAYHTEGAVSYYIRYNPQLIKDGAQGFIWSKKDRYATFTETELINPLDYDSSDVEHAGWYYIPVERQKATWLKPYANKNLGIYMISYTIPIYIDGVLIAVVGMDADFSIIINELNRLVVYKNGYAYLTDENKSIVYHRDYLKDHEKPAVSTQMLEQGIGLANNWNVYVVAPKQEIYAARNRLIPLFIGLTLLIAALFIFLCTKITRRIINPLLELTDATKKIASGDLNVHISVHSNDEIGILADTFQKTVQHLPEFMYRDSLTGVRNATAYKRTVTQLEERMAEGQPVFGICVLDVNNLKQTNDIYGHEVGNQLIINATRLICHVFAHSPVFRIGGDEFVAILENSDYQNRESLLKQFARESGATTFTAAGTTFTISVAYGLSCYNSSSDKNYADIFNRADSSMYEKKKEIKAHMPQ